MTPEQQAISDKLTHLHYTTEYEDTGCVLVMASGIGCIATCMDQWHADYVIHCLKSGRLKMGEKGLERCNDT